MNTSTTIVPATESTVGSTFRGRIQYAVLQTGQVLSFFGYLFVGYHIFLSRKNLRKTLGLHVICVLLAINFVQLVADISLALQYLYTGIVRPSTEATCTTWMFIDSFTYYLSLLLMAWASAERHLLIFHAHLFNEGRNRFFFHYLPISAICLYALAYYVFVDYFYPCTNVFDFSSAFCGLVCYMNLATPTLFGIEMMAHQVLPTFLIALLSGGLLVRTIVSRRQLQQSIEWRKYRKMILQLLCISLVYLFFSIPFSVNPIAQLAGKPTPFSYDLYLNLFSYWAYGICIFLPFVTALSLPNAKQTLKQLVTLKQPQRVAPPNEVPGNLNRS